MISDEEMAEYERNKLIKEAVELIPARYRDKRFVSQEKINQLMDKSLFLSSCIGSGKTQIAWNLYYEYKMRKANCIFLKFIDHIGRLRNREAFPETPEMHRISKNCRVLIIDDIGIENITEFSRVCLLEIIDARYEAKLITVITSNKSISDISAQIDDRIASRISEGFTIVDLGVTDHRMIKRKRIKL